MPRMRSADDSLAIQQNAARYRAEDFYRRRAATDLLRFLKPRPGLRAALGDRIGLLGRFFQFKTSAAVSSATSTTVLDEGTLLTIQDLERLTGASASASLPAAR